MKRNRPESICYTIEREFLDRITVTELVNRIIQHYMREKTEKEVDAP